MHVMHQSHVIECMWLSGETRAHSCMTTYAAVVLDYSKRVWVAGAEPKQACPAHNRTQENRRTEYSFRHKQW